MKPEEILAALDTEIARLTQVRALLTNDTFTKRRGRPPGSGRAATKKRTMSAAGRMRVAEAQRKRWAKQKKQQGTAVKVTRVAAKHASKKRVVKAARKAKTALTGAVPKQPVAAPAKTKDE